MDFDFSAETAARARREDTLPPEPAKPPERSAWGWVPRIVQSTAAGVAGSVADVVKGAAAADALTLGADPRARGAFTEQQLQEGATEGMRQIATGDALTSDLGESFRQVQKDARPDPVTAGEAERLVFGLAEPLLKLIGAGVTMGPFGLAGASAEIGFQQSDDLRQQGVDIGTRTAVGALTAGVTAASVALPMVGPTVKATAGLYALGGASNIAQVAMTREILRYADYAKIGEQFDPMDPMLWVLSFGIPAPFAAAHGIRLMRAGKNATPTAGTAPLARDLPAEVPRAPDAAAPPLRDLEPSVVPAKADIPKVTPEAVDAAMVHNLTLLRDAQEAVPPITRAAEVMRGPVTENPNFKDWFGDSKVVDEAGRPMVVYHGTTRQIEGDFKSREDLYGGGWSAGIYFTKDPTYAEQYTYNLSGPDQGYANDYTGGNVVPVYLSIKNPKVIDGALDSAHVGREQIAALKADGYDGIVNLAGDEIVAFDASQIKSSISPDLPARAPADATAPPARPAAPEPAPAPATQQPPAPPDLGPLAPAVEQARTIFEANGKAIDQYLATSEVPPEVNNLLIGLSEAGKDPRRVAAFLDLVAKQDKAKGPADATADAVEGMRSLTDEQLTGTEPDTFKPAIDPLMQSISDRVAAVQLAAPDMVVGLDASGNPITVADEIARIRKEAFEGTDTELGAADADLVNVAANCALSVGA